MQIESLDFILANGFDNLFTKTTEILMNKIMMVYAYYGIFPDSMFPKYEPGLMRKPCKTVNFGSGIEGLRDRV